MNSTLKLTIFSFASFIFLFIVLFLSKKLIKKEKTKDMMILVSSIVTIIVHYSILLWQWTHHLKVEFTDNMYLPVYPCNAIMWMCLVLSFLPKKSNAFSYLADFVAIVGTICSAVGLCFNFNFYDNPNLLDFDILKGLVSHVTMLYTTLYLFVMGYVKINTFHNIKSCLMGCVLFILCGVVSITVKKILGQNFVNSFFLIIDWNKPYYNFYFIIIVGLPLLFLLFTLYETIFYKKENRWYYKENK